MMNFDLTGMGTARLREGVCVCRCVFGTVSCNGVCILNVQNPLSKEALAIGVPGLELCHKHNKYVITL